jgi:hypothetical protein
MLPGLLSWDEVCSAPIMPPELSALWIADWASDNQLDEVLEAIAGVDAIVVTYAVSGVLAAGAALAAVEELPEPVVPAGASGTGGL